MSDKKSGKKLASKKKSKPKKKGLNSFVGAFEFYIFMRSAQNHFNNDMGRLKRSFIVPLVAYLFCIVFMTLHRPYGMEDVPAPQMILMYTEAFTIGWLLYLCVIQLATKLLDREENFIPFVSAYNWLASFGVILLFPIMALSVFSDWGWEKIERLNIIITLYAYAVQSFALWRVLNIPVSLGIALAIVGMFINEMLWDIICLLNGLNIDY